MKTKHWIFLFTALVLLAAGSYFWLSGIRRGTTAAVYRDGALLHTVDLDAVRTAYTFTVPAPGGGENVVLVEPGQISVSSATCPDQICVAHAPIQSGVEPIACLPHKLLIQLETSEPKPADATTG